MAADRLSEAVAPYLARIAAALTLALAAFAAHGGSDTMSDLIDPEGAAAGVVVRSEQSPYRGAGHRYDFIPLYLYEGRYLYLRSYRLGVKYDQGPWRFDVFLQHRFEGHPFDRVPQSLAGMQRREPGADVGVNIEWRGAHGAAFVELMRDATAVSHGAELRLGYRHELAAGRLRLRPQAMLGLRDGTLNNYYYGVEPAEATALRPAYGPGSGAQLELGVHASYRLSGGWHAIAGITALRRPEGVRKSPVVDDGVQTAAVLGLLYDFTPQTRVWPEDRPLIARAFYGASSECDVMQIVRLVCTKTHTEDPTDVAGFEIGRPFIERLNGWPLDFATFVGLVRHKEHGLQTDFWQINGYIKAYYYGLPWSHRVMTRLGFGAGLSYARRVPFMEQRDQALRARGTSRLLNYMDPTVDLSLGDLLGVRELRDTFVGLGVSHRSGIFGSSQLLGNVDGGSNYIYGYVESSF